MIGIDKMDIERYSRILEKKGLKPTANRLMILKAMLSEVHPVSVTDLENILITVDKSSIFRVLSLFVSRHVAHAIEDGSGVLKYEICSGEEECTIDDMHTHFYCESCHQTFCFKTIHVPTVELPEGFVMHSINYMVKGICPKCMAKKSNQ